MDGGAGVLPKGLEVFIMKKSAVLAMVLGMTLVAGGAVSAAPATNYENGATTVELGAMLAPDLKVEVGNNSTTGDDKTRFYGGVTVGLGNNYALSYNYAENKADHMGGSYVSGKLTTHDVNVNYKINDNLYAYVGDMIYNAKAKVGTSEASKTKNNFQAGVRYVGKPVERLGWWAGLGGGENHFKAEVGASYNLTQNVDFDLSYKYLKVNKLAGVNGFDAKASGLYTGVTLHF